jgi:membrane protease subunit HflK
LTAEAASTGVETLLTGGKGILAESVRRRTQVAADAAETGLLILSVSVASAGPPVGAESAFNAVGDAAAEKERRSSESEGKRSEVLALARGEAERIRKEAEAARSERVESSRGARDRFVALAREVASERVAGEADLRREARVRILSKARLVALPSPSKGSGVRVVLPAGRGTTKKLFAPSIIPEDMLPKIAVPEEQKK